MTKSNDIALLSMRVGLFFFMLYWALSKLLEPAGAGGIINRFYGVELGALPVTVVGIAQIALLVAFVAGAFKTVTYGAVLAMNLLTVVVTWKPILFALTDSGNMLFVASVPVLTASFALFMMREHDNLLAFDAAKTGGAQPAE